MNGIIINIFASALGMNCLFSDIGVLAVTFRDAGASKYDHGSRYVKICV